MDLHKIVFLQKQLNCELQTENRGQMQFLLFLFFFFVQTRRSTSEVLLRISFSSSSPSAGAGTGAVLNSMMNERNKPASITISNLNPTHLTSSLDDIRLIYLDEILEPKMVLQNNLRNPQIIRKLDVNTDFFSSTKKCMDFIDQVKNEQVFLVAWAPTAEKILPRIHHLTKLSAIFLFFDSPSTYHHLLNEWKKVIEIFKDQTDLMNSIGEIIQDGDLSIMSIDSNDSNDQSAMKDWSSRHFSFLHDRLLLKALKDESHDHDKKQELIDKCRGYYRHDPEAMRKLDEFNCYYTANKALQWYVNKTFLYKMLNRAFRMNDTNEVSCLGFFINDLCSSLGSGKKGPLTLYHGQKLRSDQINLLEHSIGKHVAIKGFFTASSDKDTILSAVKHINASIARVFQDLTPVFFEIHTDGSQSIVINDTQTYSEYLFTPTTTFYVNTVIKDTEENLIVVNMKTSDEGEKCVQRYMDSIDNGGIDSSPAICFGYLLCNPLNNLSQTQLYLKRLLKESALDEENRVEVYLRSGDVYLKDNNSKLARQQYDAAIEICSKAIHDQHKEDFRYLLMDCWIRMSQAYLNGGDSKNALRSVKKAIDHYSRFPQADDKRLGEIYRMKGRTYLFMYKQDHKLNQNYWHDENVDKARRYIDLALKQIKQDNSIDKYNRLIESLLDLSELHEIQGDIQQARYLLRDRIEIVEKHLKIDHSKQIECIRDYCRLCKAHKMKSEAMAIINKINGSSQGIVEVLMFFGDYLEACEILFKTKPVDEEKVTKCLETLSRSTTNESRIDIFEKWLTYLQCYYSRHHHRTAYAFLYLAVKHDRQRHDEIVQEYLKQSQSIFKYNHDRRGLRTIEDFQRHRQEKTKYRFHLGDTICHDMYVNGFAPSSMASLDGRIFH